MNEIRPPIVTILGHVDHGKTTLLDFIRKTSVASREHGGITQHIGAYQITHNSSLITFIDTPGHAAFEKMRGRGAKVADIAILVVAIDDGVMPQTIEAIKHIQASNVPMIVAVTKIDLPGIDQKVQLEKIKKQLSDEKALVEEYGGDVPIIALSAKTGEGVDKLLEMIELVAEVHELKGDVSAAPAGVVIESHLDKFKGPVATLLIRNGTLKKGDAVLIGGVKGKIKGMFDWDGKSVDEAGPSTPVEVLGLEGVSEVGAVLGGSVDQRVSVSEDQKSLIDKLRQGESKTLKVIIKADKQGSVEAIEDALQKFNKPSLPSGEGKDEKLVEVVSKGTGDITESDVQLADSIRAIILGFNVKVGPTASKMAEAEKVLIQTYNIIYELLEDLDDVIESMLKVTQVEEVLGKATVLAEFPHGKDQKIAGSRILEGGFSKGNRIRVLRDGENIGEAKIASLRKVKEEVTSAGKGNECGMIFDPQIDFTVGDTIEVFRII